MLRTASSGQLLRRGQDALEGLRKPESVHSHRLDEEMSRPHARQDRQASLGADLWRAGRDQKSPVRRCFKSRPPLGGVRRFASGCRSSQGRLTGLLSRSPPTDTRPQARAYWARSLFERIAPRRKGFLRVRLTILSEGDETVGASERTSARAANVRSGFSAAGRGHATPVVFPIGIGTREKLERFQFESFLICVPGHCPLGV